MSSHRSRGAYAVDPRAAGRRRVVGATTATAVGGTALAVLFGSVFAQAFAAESGTPTAPVQAALSLPDKSAGTKHAPKPPAAAPKPAAGAPAASSGGS